MPLDNLVAGRAGGAPAIKAMIECRRAWAPHSQPCDGTGGGPGRRHPGIQRQFLFGTVVGFPWSGSQKESRSCGGCKVGEELRDLASTCGWGRAPLNIFPGMKLWDRRSLQDPSSALYQASSTSCSL